MFLICHVSPRDQLIKRACKFMGGSSLCHVVTLISLLTISIKMVEYMFLICHVASRAHKFKG